MQGCGCGLASAAELVCVALKQGCCGSKGAVDDAFVQQASLQASLFGLQGPAVAACGLCTMQLGVCWCVCVSLCECLRV